MASFGSGRSGGTTARRPSGRPKYRSPGLGLEEEDEPAPLNIMCDPRVVRGKTRGILVGRGGEGQEKAAPARRARPRPKPQWKQTVAEIHDSIQVAPRQRTEVPLHLYLEEQSEPTPTVAASSQTDRFLKEPEEKPYVPPKSGLDAATQVETAQVFDFDRDVAGLLDTVVGKTLDQALMEVSEETELELARAHRERLDAQLAREREETARLERAELERFQAKERVLAEARVRHAELRATEKKLAAASFAREYLGSLQSRVLDRLEGAGHFYDPVQRQVEEYLPELAGSVSAGVETVRTARRLVDLLTEQAAAGILAERDQAREAREREERKKRMNIQLHIHCEMFGDRPVGPLRLRALATIRDVEEKVCEWVSENLEDGRRLTNFEFTLGSSGERLEPGAVLYEIGIENLGDLRLHLERLPSPPASDGANSGDEDDEDDE